MSSHGSTPVAEPLYPSLARGARVEILPNGLTVCVLESRQAPVVTTAVCYRVGTRDEPPGQAGVAHFLEHMMFRGSARFGPGEIDRLTQERGGAANAFTSHDATAYHFSFSSERWTEALAIEADRMAALTLDEEAIEAERRVILEELALYEDDPWDSLAIAVQAAFFRQHPYGRQVLGTRQGLQGVGREELAAFHRRFYRPDGAALVVAGDVDERALAEVTQRFGDLPAGVERRPSHPPRRAFDGLRRLRRRKGEVPRMLLELPAPPALDPDCAAVRLLTTLLGGGRTSRLHRALVEEAQVCASVSADFAPTLDRGSLTIGLELLPGEEPDRVEAMMLAELREVRVSPPAAAEIERARRVLLADWMFAHERVHQQALTAAWSLALVDLGFPERELRAALGCGAEELVAAASCYLDPQRDGVIGWSLPSPNESADGS